MKPTKFDIALSFSGKNRTFVKMLRDELVTLGLSVFYDEDYQASLAGEELTEILPSIYGENCQLCVMVISKDYLESIWTRLERRAALEKALLVDGHVIPIRLDQTQIPGLRSTISYLDATKLSLNRMANILGLKVLQQRITRHAPEELEQARRQAHGLVIFGNETDSSSLPQSDFWDFNFNLDEFRRIPNAINGKALSPIPIAQAHLYIVSNLVCNMPGELWMDALQLLGKETENSTPSSLKHSYENLSEYLRSWSFSGSVYSLQVSLLSFSLNFIGHESETNYRTSVYDIWPENQVNKMFQISEDSHIPIWRRWRILNESKYFSWHDNINSATIRNRKPRANIGLINSCYFSYTGPDAIVFGEVHIH